MSNIITRALRNLIASAVEEALDARDKDRPQPQRPQTQRPQAEPASLLPLDMLDTGNPTRTVSVRQAADLLGLARETVRGACREGRVASAYHDSDGEWRIPIGELQSGPLAKIRPRPERQRRDK